MVEPVTIALEPIGLIDAFVNAAAGSLLLPCDSTKTASAPSFFASCAASSTAFECLPWLVSSIIPSTVYGRGGYP